MRQPGTLVARSQVKRPSPYKGMSSKHLESRLMKARHPQHPGLCPQLNELLTEACLLQHLSQQVPSHPMLQSDLLLPFLRICRLQQPADSARKGGSRGCPTVQLLCGGCEGPNLPISSWALE